MDNELEAGRRNDTALERLRLVSQALSDAARRTRISTRSRRGYASGGFQARRGVVAMRRAIIISFYLCVVIPGLLATVYYECFASDQYVAVANFTVAGGDPIPIDGLASLTGIPAMAIVRDTQIIVNYIHSRAAVDKMMQMIDLRALYSAPTIDWLSRFNADKPIERLVSYWDKMVGTSIKMPSGAVELTVRAFTPQDSVRIAQALVVICEQLINDLNDRMHRDAISSAEEELRRSFDRLVQTQVALEQARNDQGMLDATKAADALNKLITDTRASLLQLQEQYNSQLKFVSATAPQAQTLKARIDMTQAQVQELQSKLTNTKTSTSGGNLASAMTRFSELDLEHSVAQRMYAGATAALEASRLVSEHKMMYLNTFVKPTIPEQAEYPTRGLHILLIVGGGLLVWGACCGLAVTIRNHMA